jgi:hypothetical protein
MQFIFHTDGIKITHKKDSLLLGENIFISDYQIFYPGEYEIGGVFLQSKKIGKNNLYRFELDGFSIIYFRDGSVINEENKVLKESGTGDILILENMPKKEMENFINIFDPKVVFVRGSLEEWQGSAIEVKENSKINLDQKDLLESERKVFVFS